MGLVPLVLNALDGQARVALARGDASEAQRLAEQLLDEARADRSTQQLDGTYEHLIRLTLYRAFVSSDAPRAERLLAEAHAALTTEAERIHDVELRQLFLSRITEHREIVELWTERQRRLR